MRWKLGLGSLALAVVFWAICLLAYPYTSMGVGPQYLRPGVADLSAGSAIIALVLLVVSALVVFWERENRRGAKAIAFALVLLLFGGTALARLLWIQFYVLA